MTDYDLSHEKYLAERGPARPGFVRTSRYLVMRDGARIAVDVCLPRDLGSARVPAIVRSTRYFRRFRLAPALRGRVPDVAFDPMNAPMRDLFTAHGYAWIDVDARGSGASFGERPCPWYIEGEVRDGADIVDWIVRQPWSNGRVGATGVSYDGTTSEFLLWNRHPAVRAVAPRFSLFDAYADVAFPGGLHLSWFTELWGAANAALDRNRPEEMVATVLSLRAHGARDPSVADEGSPARRLVSLLGVGPAQRALRSTLATVLGGVAPVDDDPDGALLQAAIASHANNYNVHQGALETTFRDDVPRSAPLPGQSISVFSPSTYVDELRASGAAVLHYSGWFDGAYPNAAIKRHRALSGPHDQLLIGPWVHGGLLNLDPSMPARDATFDHAAELLRFFDRHLLTDAREGPPPPRVRTFAMGAGWRSSSTWPPPDVRAETLQLIAGRRLAPVAGAPCRPEVAVDEYVVDTSAGTGRRTRWETLLSPFVHADWPDRARRQGLLVYQTDPLDRHVEVTGHPVLVLSLESTTHDGAIFAYLEDVAPDGQVRCITEGMLRTIHRTTLATDEATGLPRVEATFLRRDARAPTAGTVTHAIELLPTSWIFRRRHRVRLALAGADVDHFTTPHAPRERPFWRVHVGGASPSRLILPVARR
ncbi:MAG: CocE/NonD family hydrolase [Deltaproteobacteria bacterium]|nr:CocE/NonD family hydrolase [Deltaproteobacteria bacterium]